MARETNYYEHFQTKRSQYFIQDTDPAQYINNALFGSKRMRVPECRIFNPVTKKFLLWLTALFCAFCLLGFKTYSTEQVKYKHYYAEISLPNVIMHLDLKGSPMHLSYMKGLLAMLRAQGVTGVLMDYGDMFPYENELANLSSKYAYDRLESKELRVFLKGILKFGFEIIPLVQTFGHMEYVLKHKEFQHLKEPALHSDVICPSNPKSLELVRNILDQIINFHQSVFPLKHILIGTKKVYHWNVNKCKRCLQRNQTYTNLFFDYVNAITNHIKSISPLTTVLMLDDMLRDISKVEWENIKTLNVEPVYWDYSSTAEMSQETQSKYHENFQNVWIASAFKGADNVRIMQPIMANRFSNIYSWMELIRNYKSVNNFRGIILTGWSRYLDQTPSEPFPVALPSLLLVLLLIDKYKDGTNFVESDDPYDFYEKNFKIDFSYLLSCNEEVELEYFDTTLCSYDGTDLYATVNSCDSITFHINSFVADNLLNYIDINPQMGPNYKTYNETLYDLWRLEKKLIKIMSRYYMDHFVKEYAMYKINRAKNILYRMLSVNSNGDDNFRDLVGTGKIFL